MSKKTEQYRITHNKIIDTVTEMMGSVAFEKITIRDICRRCDISIGNFYHHFRSKEEILQMAYQQFDEILEAGFPEEMSFADAGEELLYLFERELVSIRDIGHYAATQIFRTQLLFEEPFILEENRFFYKKLTEAAEKYLREKELSQAQGGYAKKNDLLPETTEGDGKERSLPERTAEEASDSSRGLVEELLRVSRGSIYDWCLHHGSYDLVQTALATIRRLLG